MKYTQAAGEKSTVKLTITFSEEEWQDALNKSYLKVRVDRKSVVYVNIVR